MTESTPTSLHQDSFLAQLCYRISSKSIHKSLVEKHRYPSKWQMTLLKKAADLGHVAAISELGCLLLDHGATRTDKRKGMEYLYIAAKRDNAVAQYQMGRIYLSGLELFPKDRKQAMHWFALASNQGHEDAAKMLSKCIKDNGNAQTA